MPNADTKVWKDTLSQLKSEVSTNSAMITGIREQIELEQSRSKKELQELVVTAAGQIKELEELASELQGDDLFSLPGDKEAKEAFVAGVNTRLEQSRQVYDFACALLDTATTPKDVIDQILSASSTTSVAPAKVEEPETAEAVQAATEPAVTMEDVQNSETIPLEEEEEVLSIGFSPAALYGNWIHYFSKDKFTCQSFWEDGEVREYDFVGSNLVEERTGQYEVRDGKVYLKFTNATPTEYTVTGYSDDCLDYLVDSKPIRFDYMPEHLLNSLFEDSAQQ